MEEVYVFYFTLDAEITGKSGRDFFGPVDPGAEGHFSGATGRLMKLASPGAHHMRCVAFL